MGFKRFPVEYQLDKMDCGPACLKIIAKYYGRIYNLHFLRTLCGTTREGISVLNITNGAEKIGLKTRVVRCSFTQLLEVVPLPCIVHWRENHFVVVYDVDAREVAVSDPSKGLVKYSHKEFRKGWLKQEEKKGVVIGIEPEADFQDIHIGEKRSKRKSYSGILNYFKPYRKSIVNLLLVMLFITVLQALIPFITRAIIDTGVHTYDMNFINIMLVANVVILLSMTLGNAVRDWIVLHLTSRINISLISDYLVKLMKLPLSFFENKMMGDILQRANDHQRIRDFIMGNSLNLVFSAVTFLVFAVILAVYNSLIFWTFAIGSVVYFAWIIAFMQIRKQLDTNYFNLMARDQSYWVETISGIQDIKVNNYEKDKRWAWENIQARLYKVNVRLLSVTNYQNLGGQFIEGLKNLIITIICAKAVVKGEMSFGVMISTQIIIGMLNGPVQQFIQFIISAQVAKLSLARINEIHALEDEEIPAETNSMELPECKDITVSNLSFQYAPRHAMVLNKINLFIPEKKVTAIVGDSGSGKSTLLKLLLRLYIPTAGEIKIGNMNINNISLFDWREKCGVVLQDGKIFNDTILNNIVLSSDKVDYDRLKKAVGIANIADEIENMPKGYMTKLGEQGRGISGGQKQRILIARALYKNPEYLFFDEATNSLDTINEKRIIEALDETFNDKTVVVIAHRLSTIRKADQIIVLKQGRIVETGKHDQLMERKGHYCSLVETQMFAQQHG
ncbi:peptidase domain-containing ABC transporter [Chitinophaga sp. 22620]|uniref:peptidase domain-containing ABC transporter n=1 Tax=Chitinophaga sp. 22620 TaxID=3453952 RepID=UPI003F853BE5